MTLEIGDRIWWQHTASHVRYGTVKELTERPGVQCDDGEWLYLDADQIHLLANLSDGVYRNFPYHSNPARLSPHGAKKLLPPSTPARFDYDRKHPQKPRRVLDFGTVAHKLVLGEGEQLIALDPQIHGMKKDGTLADNPRATTTWKDAEASARIEGLTPIHIDDYHKAVEMAQVVHRHEIAGLLLAEGDAEVWLYWTDTQSSQGMRQRLDWITQSNGRTTIVEYKTAADASPENFSRAVFKFGYNLACAFAVMGAKALGLDSDPRYVIIAQEKEPPYQVSIHELDTEAFQYSCQKIREAVAIYQRCLNTGEWPGYPTDMNTISLPLWAIDEEMEFAE